MTKEEKNIYFETYNKQIHFIGHIGSICFIALVITIPFMLGSILGAMPDMGSVLSGTMKTLPLFLPSCIIEFLLYAPMLGSGGSYLAFITGNLGNLKIPCTAAAKEIAGTKAGTPESEIISTLSIAISSLVTVVVILIGVIMLVPLQPILQNPTLIPAFNHVVPALFGALGFKYLTKNWKISIAPITVLLLLYLLIPSLITQSSLMITPAGGIAIGMGYILYRKNK